MNPPARRTQVGYREAPTGSIALVEAFPSPSSETLCSTSYYRPCPTLPNSGSVSLADFTEYRLPEMDAAGIDIHSRR